MACQSEAVSWLCSDPSDGTKPCRHALEMIAQLVAQCCRIKVHHSCSRGRARQPASLKTA